MTEATGTALTFPETLREGLEAKRAEIMRLFQSDSMTERFIMVALTAATKNEKLRECSMASIFLAIMESAHVGLMPDNKEAALIPYAGQAEFMPMVQGIIRLMLRSPGLVKVEARTVHEGDNFAFKYGIHPQLDHIPLPDGKAEREITHAYAIMWRQGAEPTFEVMGRDELDLVRANSRAPNSPAYTHYLGEMFRKIVLKRLAKYADLSPEATRAIEVDHAVTGDPWGTEYADGPTDEFRNLLVKGQTVESLARLKDKMTEEGNGDAELPDDGKKEPAPEPPFDEGEESETRGPTTIETDEPNEGFSESVSERTSELTDDEKGQAIIDAVETGDLVPAGIDIDKPMELKLIRDFLDQRVKMHKGKRTNDDLVKQLVMMMAECLVGVENIDADRHRILLWQWGVESTNKLRGSELRASLDHLRMKEGRDGRFHPNAVGARELRAIATFMRVGDTKKDNEEAA